MNWVPVSREKHKDKAVTRTRNYDFARESLFVPICNNELKQAVLTFPLFFLRKNDSIQLFGLMGLQKDQNLFVNSDGSWLVDFLPRAVDYYPLALAASQDGKRTLIFAEDSGHIVDRDKGYPLFNEDGSESEHTKKLIAGLTQAAASEDRQKEACAILDEFKLLKPFEQKVPKADGSFINFEGVLSIDVPKLRQLDESKYVELRKLSCMDIIYGHLFSLNSINLLLSISNTKERSGANLKSLGQAIFDDTEQELNFDFT
jgi:hypothetical protein